MITDLRILGKSFSVEIVPDTEFKSDIYGRVNMRRGVIYCADDMTLDQQRETILHEVIHAVEFSLGMESPEGTVYALSAGLYAVFRDNPELLAYLGDTP